MKFAVGQSVKKTTKMLAQLSMKNRIDRLYFGQPVLEDAENFAQEVEELYPDVDVDVRHGGQFIIMCSP